MKKTSRKKAKAAIPESSMLDLFDEIEEQAENEDDVSNISKEEIRQATLTGTDWTVETLLSQIDKGNINLNPSFQRREAWNDVKKSHFIESVFSGYPIPQIVLAEKRNARGEYIVLDGKQRLISLKRFASDDPKIALKLSGLKVRRDLNGKTMSSLKQDIAYRADVRFFENNTIRTIVIKSWPNENFLYSVFLRLNTNSVTLSPQELRQALHPGPFLDFVEESSRKSTAMRGIFRKDIADFRMRDAELLVRFYAFSLHINKYKGNLKDFLDKTCGRLNQDWEDQKETIFALLADFEAAHELCVDIFGKNAYRLYTTNGYEKKFNRAIFDIMLYAFKYSMVRAKMATVAKRNGVLKLFEKLCTEDPDFQNAITLTTKSKEATTKRINTWLNQLNKAVGTKLEPIALS